jgi:MFS family permease
MNHDPAPPRLSPNELLSALWIFATLNYLYADVMSLMDPILLPQWVSGRVGEIAITRPLLLASAAMMEVPIAMTILARILPYRSNRVANIAAGLFKTLAIVGSLAAATPNLHYLFYASIETATTIWIVVFAWRWRPGK